MDDEVICGFGRTGNAFGCQTYDFQPDTMSIAKALSSAYMPISAVLLSPELTEIIEAGSHAASACWGMPSPIARHPVAAAVALKTLEIYERRDIFGHVRKVAPVFLQRLKALADHPLVGEANGVGLIGGHRTGGRQEDQAQFRSRQGAWAPSCGQFCQDEGLIVRALLHDRIALCPPLVISEAEIGEIVRPPGARRWTRRWTG